jgi:hypothetical protein
MKISMMSDLHMQPEPDDDEPEGHYEPFPFRRLAGSVVVQSLRDYFSRKAGIEKQVDAALWLRSEDSRWYFEALDLFDIDVMKLLTAPSPPRELLKKWR